MATPPQRGDGGSTAPAGAIPRGSGGEGSGAEGGEEGGTSTFRALADFLSSLSAARGGGGVDADMSGGPTTGRRVTAGGGVGSAGGVSSPLSGWFGRDRRGDAGLGPGVSDDPRRDDDDGDHDVGGVDRGGDGDEREGGEGEEDDGGGRGRSRSSGEGLDRDIVEAARTVDVDVPVEVLLQRFERRGEGPEEWEEGSAGGGAGSRGGVGGGVAISVAGGVEDTGGDDSGATGPAVRRGSVATGGGGAGDDGGDGEEVAGAGGGPGWKGGAGGSRHRHRRTSLLHDLMLAQSEMVVIQFMRGSSTCRYRRMRRSDVLKEARQYAQDLAALAALLSASGVGGGADSRGGGGAGARGHGAGMRGGHGAPVPPPSATTVGPATARPLPGPGGVPPHVLMSYGPDSLFIVPPTGTLPMDSARVGALADVGGGAPHARPPPITWGKRSASSQGGAVGGGEGGGAAGVGPTIAAVIRQLLAGGGDGSIVSSALQSRDLRVIDPAFEISREPAILVRRHCIVFNVPPVRAIIMAEKCFFFTEDGADEILIPILARLTSQHRSSGGGVGAGKPGGMEAAVYVQRRPSTTVTGKPKLTTGSAAEGTEHGGNVEAVGDGDGAREDADLPFEFFALETFLLVVVQQLKADFKRVSPRVRATIKKLTSNRATTTTMFDSLRRVKRALADFISQIKAVHRVLEELLATQEDLRSMALTALLEAEQGAASILRAALQGEAHVPSLHRHGAVETHHRSPSPTGATREASDHHPSPAAAAGGIGGVGSGATPSTDLPILPPADHLHAEVTTPLLAHHPRSEYTLLGMDAVTAGASPGVEAQSPATAIGTEGGGTRAAGEEAAQVPRLHMPAPPVPLPPQAHAALNRQGSWNGQSLTQFQTLAADNPAAAASAIVEGVPLDDFEDAAEVLIESYLAEVEALLTQSKLLRDELEGAENQMNLMLANNRNRLLKAEIGITTVTMCMTACSVVAGYFGMNIENRLEGSYPTFLIVVIACSAAAALIAIVLGLYLRTILR